MTTTTTRQWHFPVLAGNDNRARLLVDLNMMRGEDVIWGGERDQPGPLWQPLHVGQDVWLLDDEGCRTPARIIRLWHPPFGDGKARHYEARVDWSQRSGWVRFTYHNEP